MLAHFFPRGLNPGMWKRNYETRRQRPLRICLPCRASRDKVPAFRSSLAIRFHNSRPHRQRVQLKQGCGEQGIAAVPAPKSVNSWLNRCRGRTRTSPESMVVPVAKAIGSCRLQVRINAFVMSDKRARVDISSFLIHWLSFLCLIKMVYSFFMYESFLIFNHSFTY